MFDTVSFPELIYFAVLVIGAGLLVRNGYIRQNTTEATNLAETRGEKIDDLREEMKELKRHMVRLEGKLEALEALKVQEIVDGVVEGIRPFLVNE